MGMLRKASLSDLDMNIVKEYGKYIEKTAEKDPAHALRQILFGLRLEQYKLDHHPDPKLPSALQGLNREATRCVRSTLAHPETTAWTNIFAPVELLMSFGLQAMSMECIASYLSGFLMENYFIDRAQDAGIAETLCSYHKNFIGAASTGLLPRPLSAVTTSLACDGNVSTFRYLRDTGRIDDFFLLDIPYEDSPAAEDYVTEQLRQYVAVLEEKTGKPYDEERLRQQIRRENLSHRHYLSFLQKRMTHAYPSTPGMVLFLLLASHLYIGSEWVLKFFEHMGSKLLYVIVEWKTFLQDPWSVLGSSGFVVYGGIITGVLAVYVFCKRKHLDFKAYFNLLMPAVALAQGFGRIGCFCAGCCYGRVTTSPLGVEFPVGSLAPAGVKILPTQLFSSAGDFIIFAVLYWNYNHGKHPRIPAPGIWSSTASAVSWSSSCGRMSAARSASCQLRSSWPCSCWRQACICCGSIVGREPKRYNRKKAGASADVPYPYPCQAAGCRR